MKKRPSALAPRGPAVWRARLAAQRFEERSPFRYVLELGTDRDVDGTVTARLSCGHTKQVNAWRDRVRCVLCLEALVARFGEEGLEDG